MIASNYNIDGTGYHVYNLSKYLVERGHNIEIIVRGCARIDVYQVQTEIGLIHKIRYLPVYPFHLDFHKIFVEKYIAKIKKKFDIIHAHNSNFPYIENLEDEYVLTVHGTLFEHIKNRPIKDFHSLGLHTFSPVLIKHDRLLVKKAKKVIAVSYDVKNSIIHNYGRSDVTVVHNGVDSNFFKPNTASDFDFEYILYTGRHSPEKGLDDLIKSASSVIKEYPKIKYIITGSGPLTNYIKKLIDTLDLQENVILTGRVSLSQLLRYYQNASLYILPSLFEGLPTSLMEAMSCGLPNVSTIIPSIQELAIDGKTSILVPPKNARILADETINLIENSKLRKKLGKNSRKRVVTCFSWDKIGSKIENIYNKII
jgi:glycosyltransferase involved in cell wall biosynthesis